MGVKDGWGAADGPPPHTGGGPGTAPHRPPSEADQSRARIRGRAFSPAGKARLRSSREVGLPEGGGTWAGGSGGGGRLTPSQPIGLARGAGEGKGEGPRRGWAARGWRVLYVAGAVVALAACGHL